MINSEYHRFLQSLNNSETPEGVRKVANLVLRHLDELEPLTTYHGKRIKRFVEIANTNWDSIDAEVRPHTDNSVEESSEVIRISSLSVGPFRGFASKENFDLASNVVLVYGPNGTGKSSFCEALEFGLLGHVAEAENKRFRKQRDYLKNSHVNKFSEPVILAENESGDETTLVSDSEKYRFCFVEKNRIDSFSQIAAHAPAKQTELISALFGLESFTKFVRNFSESIDEKYMDVTGVKASKFALKKSEFSDTEKQHGRSEVELAEISSDKELLSKSYRDDIDFEKMAVEISGSGSELGKIDAIDKELQKLATPKSNLKLEDLESMEKSVESLLSEMSENNRKLSSASDQLSYEKMYGALVQLQSVCEERCPACKTSLTEVEVDPFQNANEELLKLKDMRTLQEETKEIEAEIQQYFLKISKVIETCVQLRPSEQNLQTYLFKLDNRLSMEWWDAMKNPSTNGLAPWAELVTLVEGLEAEDIALDGDNQSREEKKIEVSRLRKIETDIAVLRSREKTAETTRVENQKIIVDFEADNKELLDGVSAERIEGERNKEIAEHYQDFVSRLSAYNDGLPALLVADLGDKVVNLYNAFNRNDSPSELIHTIRLPLVQNERLEISFQNDPGKFHDALHILSEGHMRCVGLAILLAKNLKENCPMLIFDDPVNAIDDEHRDSIRRTLFEDDYFSMKQIILACHGEEFFKDVQQMLSGQKAKAAKLFTLLPRLDDANIRVNFNSAPRNYIVAARAHIDRNEVRDALAKSRQALEFLTKEKIWSYVHRYGNGNLSLKLRGVSAPIELRNLTEQLKKQISTKDFGDPDKDKIFGPLSVLLGPDGNSREWTYLNKGTHEESDRTEFDRATAQNIVAAMEELDLALS